MKEIFLTSFVLILALLILRRAFRQENQKLRKPALCIMALLTAGTCMFTFAGCVERTADSLKTAPASSPGQTVQMVQMAWDEMRDDEALTLTLQTADHMGSGTYPNPGYNNPWDLTSDYTWDALTEDQLPDLSETASLTVSVEENMLYFNGVDSVSISKRLGHAQVSTTADIYAHVMAEADQKNADILADIFLKKDAARGAS